MHLAATPADVEAICDLVHELCGIYLGKSKSYLVENRLSELVERIGCSSYVALAEQSRLALNAELRSEIVDRMTTNETLFFRDANPFEILQHKAIPNIIDAREHSATPNRIRILSAACSTGQEPYSIAMVLSEMIPDIHDWDVTIVASDVSNDAIKTASAGVYSDHQIQRGLPDHHRNKHFERCSAGFRVRDSIRSLVKFERANLLTRYYASGEFDLIFCRNVAIYFTQEDRLRLFDKLSNTLASDGYLFVGSAEPLSDLQHRFFPEQHCRGTVYRPLSAAAHTANLR